MNVTIKAALLCNLEMVLICMRTAIRVECVPKVSGSCSDLPLISSSFNHSCSGVALWPLANESFAVTSARAMPVSDNSTSNPFLPRALLPPRNQMSSLPMYRISVPSLSTDFGAVTVKRAISLMRTRG